MIKVSSKNKDKLMHDIVEVVVSVVKPKFNNIIEKLDDHSTYYMEIKAQLDRIEKKIDLLLSTSTSATLNKNWIVAKKKIIRS